MGKKRSRNTAKTGDRALYQSRINQKGKGAASSRLISKDGDNNDDDPMYNHVDRFHNARDQEFMAFDQAHHADSGDEEEEEAVMDLGIGGESSDEEDEQEEVEEDDQEEEEEVEEEGDLEADLSADEDALETVDVRNWGRKKSDYYHGDTADLEIGQEEEDALMEEMAAKEVQAARFKDMSEEDFVLSDGEADEEDWGRDAASIVAPEARDLFKLSRQEKRKMLDKRHPEFLPLLSYFLDTVREFDQRSSVATKAIFNGEEGTAEAIGCTASGQLYLLTKAMMQSSAALNLAVYLLLKAEHASQGGQDEDDEVALIQNHPVMARLQRLNLMMEKLSEHVESKVPHLSDQLTNLVKAVALMNHGEVDDKTPQNITENGDEDVEIAEEGDDGNDEVDSDVVDDDDDDDNDKLDAFENEDNDDNGQGAGDEEDDEAEVDDRAVHRQVLTEARFGLRANEISSRPQPKCEKSAVADYGDEEPSDAGRATQVLASTINSIQQRSVTRKRKVDSDPDRIDDSQPESDGIRRGLEMMEADLGPDFDKDDDGKEDDVEDDGDEDFTGDDDLDFYTVTLKKSKIRKEVKKSMYQVAPKFPRVEEEIEGERPIGRTIMQNRGLVPSKPKKNRNPRVKKREQFRQALMRRKGAVREVRKNEGHKYGGEETGIKKNVSKSRKLA